MGNPIYFTDPDGRRADGYVDENGNYLGDDGDTKSHETRVISKDKWNELTACGEYCENGGVNQGGRERLQGESMLLSDWHHSINITQGSWDKLVAKGGHELAPYLNNTSSHTAWFKPGQDTPDQSIEDHGAYPVQPGHQIYAGIDGYATCG